MTPAQVLSQLEGLSRPSVAAGMERYGLTTDLRVLGVSVGTLHTVAKQINKTHSSDERHALAEALFNAGVYEGQLLAAFVDVPAFVTVRQMNTWAAAFDNWGVCDTACFHLFDRAPHAWERARQWSKAKPEFVKRAGFALMASMVVHDKAADDAKFLELLPLIERGAEDERNFVKKGVNWALRCIGKRSSVLNVAAVELATRLAGSEEPAPRWVGKDALRELKGPALAARLARQSGVKKKVASRRREASTSRGGSSRS